MDFLIAVAVGGLACVIVVVLIIAGHAKNDRSFPRDDIECVETADDSAMPTVSFRAKSSSHRIPEDPRFINIGKRTFHKSRDCWAFSEYDEWEACTEDEAIERGLERCPFCESRWPLCTDIRVYIIRQHGVPILEPSRCRCLRKMQRQGACGSVRVAKNVTGIYRQIVKEESGWPSVQRRKMNTNRLNRSA